MYGQQSSNSQSAQVPQMPNSNPNPPPYQHLPRAPPPPPPHNFQQNPQVPYHPAQASMPIYQHGPMAPQFPPGGMMNAGRPLNPLSMAHGSVGLPHMYVGLQQNSQPTYLAPAPEAPPSSKSLIPTPLPGNMLYGAPDHLPSPLPLPRPTSSFSTSALFANSLETVSRSSQMPSVPPLPPPRPPPCPPSIWSTPRLQPMSYHQDAFSSNRSRTLDLPSLPPKPANEKIVQKIEELCKVITDNGSSYEDMVRQKESGNPELKFLFGGEPGSEAAIAHEYFLQMKQHVLACKSNEGKTYETLRPSGVESSVQPDHLVVEAGLHSPADSDMEMEDDITQTDNDPAANQPFDGPNNTCGLTSNGFDVKEQVHVPQTSAESHGAMGALSEKMVFCGSSGVGEQEPKPISSYDHLTSQMLPVPKVHSLVINSTVSAESLSASYCENSTTPIESKNSSRYSSAAECSNPDKSSGQAIEGNSPFRLIQDYASNESSENDVEPCLKDIRPKTISPSVSVGADNLHKGNGLNLEINPGSQSSYKTEKGLGPGILSQTSVLPKALEPFSDLQSVDKRAFSTAAASGSIPKHIDTRHEDHAPTSYATSPKALFKEHASDNTLTNVAFSCKHQKDNEDKRTNFNSSAVKVDKFGRLVREGASDSDSDDLYYARRYNRKGKSRSRSRSPLNRRRSPQRRRDKRSRSCSRSPRSRRSRSRSPTYRPRHRHAGEFSAGSIRRDRGQKPDCFDYLRGRCYRGAFCRYRHHDHEKSDESREQTSRQQYQQLPISKKNSYTHKEIKKMSSKVSDHDHEQKMQLSHNSSINTAKNGIVYKREESFSNADGQSVDSEVIKLDNSDVVADQVPKADIVQQESKSCTAPVDENLQEAMKSDQSLVESFSSYMPPNQNATISVPPNFSWASLPPQVPQLPLYEQAMNAGTAAAGIPLQFQQIHMPPKEFGSQTFLRPNATELPGQSEVDESQNRAHPPIQGPRQSFLHAEDYILKPSPGCNPSSQNFGGPVLGDRLTQLPMQGLNVSGSFTQGHNYNQSVPFPLESSAAKMQSFPGDNKPIGEILNSSSEVHPHLRWQQPSYGSHLVAPHSVYASTERINSSRYQPNFLDTKQPSHQPDFGVSRSSTHYNPYASTFDQPLSSRFSSVAFRNEKDELFSGKHDHHLSLSHTFDGEGVGILGSRQAFSSLPNSAKGFGKDLRGLDGDQYDPIFDSIEPSLKKLDHTEKWEPSNDSGTMLRFGDADKPLDVVENNKKKEFAGTALATSVNNEEFGETADAEVEDIENGSQSSSPNVIANTNVGEMEIDQIKSEGKSKKSKESRSMKLFKVALADFVKEVLKPSWRQGNMSKEAFKTVVKKTVDKVAGATKGNRIPKSKAKIEQYIESSQWKLTKLVMGYVEKYAKG